MRILSYNMHKGIGGRDRLYRLERIIKVIEHENPDIVCLQEVDRNVRRSRFHNQPRLLRDYFGLADDLYQPTVQLKTGGYGNFMMTRWPFMATHRISLRYRQKKRRGAQIVTIGTPEGDLRLVNWHLGLAETERRWQADHLLGHRLYREAEGLPSMIIGDTNDWRNNLEQSVFHEAGYKEVTRPPSRYRSFPAYMPVGSLDKAFVSDQLKIVEARTVKSTLARQASDHLPLVVDFHLI